MKTGHSTTGTHHCRVGGLWHPVNFVPSLTGFTDTVIGADANYSVCTSLPDK